MPAVTNMRLLARKSQQQQQESKDGDKPPLLSDDDVQAVMNVPLAVEQLLEIILRNQQVLIQEFAHDFGVPLHVETIQHYMNIFNKQRQQEKSDTNNVDKDEAQPTPTAKSAEIVIFDDETSASELVFGIAVNQ